MKSSSLRWKMILPILSCLIVGSTATVLIAGYAARKVVLAEIEHSTMPKLRDTVLTSITSTMSASDVKRNMASFVAQMKQTADLKIVKLPVLDAQYGKGADADYAQDQYTREVIDKGTARFLLEGSTVRELSTPIPPAATQLAKTAWSATR